MEHQLWTAIVKVLAGLDKTRQRRCTFQDEAILQVYYWAVIHDRPASWACRPGNWPIHRRKVPLPSPSRLSRRLRSESVIASRSASERAILAPKRPGVFWMIDGKPLPVGGGSKDRQAGYGRASGGKAKGYKIHAILGPDGLVACWRLAPMNKDERTMAKRMLRAAPIQGYLIADSNYDSNPLHGVCDAHGDLQLIARRRRGRRTGLGHHRHSPGRLRAMELLEGSPDPRFADGLVAARNEIERRFGGLTSWGGGLACLPAWVRTYRRVHAWVQAKLVLTALKRTHPVTTCAA